MIPEEIEKQIVDNDTLDVDEVKVDPDTLISIMIKGIIIQSNRDTDITTKYNNFCGSFPILESLAKARNVLTEQYDKDVEAFKETQEYKDINDPLVKSFTLTNKKFYLLLKEYFGNRTLTEPIKA